MLPTKTLTHTLGVPWLEPQQSDVVTGTGVLLPSFQTMVDGDWYLDHSHHEFLLNDAFLLNPLDSSSSLPEQHLVVPQKPSFSSFFDANGNGFLDSGFECGAQSCFLAGLSANAPSLNAAFPASPLGGGVPRDEKHDRTALRSLYKLSPPTRYRKRMERWREAGNLEESELPPPPGRRKRENEEGLSYESDEDGKLLENGFDANDNDDDHENQNGGVGVGGGGEDQKGKKKGMPAKNLMAERRRRKKLNDRLYMLRSIVPKISKMDRASILGDAIDYLRELLQRINDLHNELDSSTRGSSLPPAASFHPVTATVKEELCATTLLSPKDQSAKVEVRLREGRAVDIHMFCARRPGLLFSIMRTLDNLGLDVQQAVISCFDGFALDVFRAELYREGQDAAPEQIKAVLLETTGFCD
ncbi:unnamed protein product [Sphenostylis stenocarpa]|uniref:BHLH domain-containing protein n=1 Tax=Sphenostylis stenocarpa TaxID=92480 RepID=A0AA86SQ86_9FABA|nr:unnamed protein product [Sphenostylis stenocarpa]